MKTALKIIALLLVVAGVFLFFKIGEKPPTMDESQIDKYVKGASESMEKKMEARKQYEHWDSIHKANEKELTNIFSGGHNRDAANQHWKDSVRAAKKRRIEADLPH